jgi:hypothetical protein
MRGAEAESSGTKGKPRWGLLPKWELAGAENFPLVIRAKARKSRQQGSEGTHPVLTPNVFFPSFLLFLIL